MAATYQAMGLLSGRRQPQWYDPGRFWSGDELELLDGARLGGEIAVEVPSAPATGALLLLPPARTPAASRDWDSYLDLAFSEITRYGGLSPQVARLLASCQALRRRLGPGRRAAVRSRPSGCSERAAGQRSLGYAITVRE